MDNSQRKKQFLQLGLTISYYRMLKGLTQGELARAVGVSQTHISNIEAPRMKLSVSLDKLFDIADVLNVPVAKLFEFRE